MNLPNTTHERIGPGRYRMKIEFELDGVVEEIRMECANVAYGARELEKLRRAAVEARHPLVAMVA